MGDRFPLPVNTGRVDGRAFPLAELPGRQLGPLTRAVNSGSGNRALAWSKGRQLLGAVLHSADEPGELSQ